MLCIFFWATETAFPHNSRSKCNHFSTLKEESHFTFSWLRYLSIKKVLGCFLFCLFYLVLPICLHRWSMVLDVSWDSVRAFVPLKMLCTTPYFPGPLSFSDLSDLRYQFDSVCVLDRASRRRKTKIIYICWRTFIRDGMMTGQGK